MRPRRCCGTVSIGGGGCGEARGHGRLEGSARRVGGACRRSRLARLLPPPLRPASPVERASATAVAILTPAGRETSGTPTVFAWETPASRRGYRFPDDGSLLRIGHVAASAERGSGDAITATGSVVLRSVELFGGILRIDVVRARRVARSERRRNRRHIRLAPRPRPPGRRPDRARPGQEALGQGLGLRGRGRPRRSQRLDRRRRHARGPAAAPDLGTRGAPRRGPTSSSARSTPTSSTSRLRPLPTPADPAGAARPARCPTGRRTRRERTTARCDRRGTRQGTPTPRHHRHAPRPPAPVKHPVDPAASGRPRLRSTRRPRAGGSGPGRLAVRLGRREPDGGRVRLLRPR